MVATAKLMIEDLIRKYSTEQVSTDFSRLYDDPRFSQVFATIHEQLNSHFYDINGRARSSRHYWAENSRDLLLLIDNLNDALEIFEKCNIPVEFSSAYRAEIDRCLPWLASSQGSEVPENFRPIKLIKYEGIFFRSDSKILLENVEESRDLTMIGEGSYAFVYSFVDPNYGKKFALKRARKGMAPRDLARFMQEYRILKRLSFPYIVEVYTYSRGKDEYTMEYCHETLRSHVSRRNARMTFSARKRIALQFLYAINYLHYKGLFHRDVSLQNVLLKTYDDGAVTVKLSDFGLVKDRESTFTRTQTEARGTILDPLLEAFKDYSAQNEIYAVGHVLSYIFTGKESVQLLNERVGDILRKCVALDLSQRYQRVSEIIAEVEQLAVAPPTATE